jgi:hypothetical protein
MPRICSTPGYAKHFTWLRDEKSLAAATWGLVIATFLLYLDSRTRGKTQDKQWEKERELRIKEQDERWAREDQLRMLDAKPKAVVEIAEKRNASEVIFQCFNLGSTAFFIDRLIVTLSANTSSGPRVLIFTYLFYAAFCFAQRLRCASAILFLPAADIVLFFGAAGESEVRGRPLRLVEDAPARKERADCKRAIWASMAERMSCVFIHVRYQRSGSSASYGFGRAGRSGPF